MTKWSLSAFLIMPVLLASFCAACESTPKSTSGAEVSRDSKAPETDSEQVPDPDRPAPVLPPVAFFLGQYAALELNITAGPDGSVQKVIVSKPSQARLYDEYTRKWVEQHWKMPPAKPGEPPVRSFIAPIVYPKRKFPDGGRYPPPYYPRQYLTAHIEGLVIVEMNVDASGRVESTRIVRSSGHEGLDEYTTDWVRKYWRFPTGEQRQYEWPVAYLMAN
jgi:TonB family protein